MKFSEIIARAIELLESKKRVSYRTLKREFGLDETGLADLKEELIEVERVGFDKDGKMLVWSGGGEDQHVVAPPKRPTPTSYTPKHLADKILQSRAALEGERKQVTILFADVKGSMALAGQLDAEDWHRLLDQFFTILGQCVHRFEGTINQYTGDGIMAIFGAPIAHEDHAQRACYAALQMLEQLQRFSRALRIERGLDFAVRIGVNSGDVVVGKIGDDLRMDYTAQGQTVGIAQRLEQLAETGHAYVSEHTVRLVEGYFQFADLGASPVTGVDKPVGVYDLVTETAARTRFHVSRARGLTRFVGRQDEMETLTSALARARSGHGQVVGVVGEPGLGKSRLCYEFVERCKAAGLPVYTAHCPAHGKSIPFLPIQELLRSYFEIAEDDSPAQARRKIAGSLLLLDPGMHGALPMLFEFLAVGDPDQPAESMDADARQRQMFQLLHRVTRIQHEKGIASLILFDDLHWIDTWSDEYVGQMVEATQSSHTLLLLNFRPEYQAAWTVKPHYQQLPLVPLGEEAVREMVASLLGGDASVRALSARVMEWTGGNPLYTEEVINTLAETEQLLGTRGAYRLARDVAALEVPPTVQAIIAARIDRLDAQAKQLLHTAAVFGKEFSRELVDQVAGLDGAAFAPAMEKLKTMDFIYEIALYPSVEYSFKHPLVHEVAYETQLKDQRARGHAGAAQALEAAAGEQVDEVASTLAYHWEHAGNTDKAVEWHRRAGLHLMSADSRAAMAHWSRVREFARSGEMIPTVQSAGAEACIYLNQLSWQLGGTEDECRGHFEDGCEMAQQAGDKKLLALLNCAYSLFRGATLGYANDYYRYSQVALQLAEELADSDLRYAMLAAHGFGCSYSGRMQEACRIANELLTQVPANESFGIRYCGMPIHWTVGCIAGFAAALCGDNSTALRALAAAKQVETAPAQLRALPHATEGLVHGLFGRFADARNACRVAMNLAETAGDPYGRAMSAVWFGTTSYWAGDLDEASKWIDYSRDVMSTTTTGGALHAMADARLAYLQVARGESHRARTTAVQTIEFCVERELYFYLEPWAAHAHACVACGDAHTARAALSELQRLIEQTGQVLYQPFFHERRAEYARAFGGEWNFETEVETACRLFRNLGAEGHAERVSAILSNVSS